jgi:hypothetical protein
MATKNPTRGKRAVPIDLPSEHLAILLDGIDACLEGVLGDLETPERLRDPARSRREANAYERLLAGLERGVVVVPDETARQAIHAMAVASDETDNYAEVVANHDALYGLLGQLTGEPKR